MSECPITLRALHEISVPAAFASAPDQPYELEALCTWLERSRMNPVTGLEVDDDILLIGDAEQRRRGIEMLMERGFIMLYGGDGDETIKELRDDLKRLAFEIENMHRIIDALVAEKARIERRLRRMEAKSRCLEEYCAVS